MVVTVNMQDLLALDAQYPRSFLVGDYLAVVHAAYPERTHSVRPGIVNQQLPLHAGSKPYLYQGRRHRTQGRSHPY